MALWTPQSLEIPQAESFGRRGYVMIRALAEPVLTSLIGDYQGWCSIPLNSSYAPIHKHGDRLPPRCDRSDQNGPHVSERFDRRNPLDASLVARRRGDF